MADDKLFWYPDRKYKDGEYDKEAMLIHDVNYWFNRLQSMFKYENLPDTIPAKWLENYLLRNGSCIIAKDDEGRLTAYVGSQGTMINVYYIPCGYIVSNPYFNKGLKATDDRISDGFSKTFKIGTDCEIVYNDTYSEGLEPLVLRYCSRMIENEITMNTADTLTRAMLIISASDDKTKASAELFLNRLKEGKLSVIASKAFIEGLNIQGFDKLADCLTNLIEYHQYLKAGLFNELGLNSNYNMKRESINSSESQLNDDMLHPLIDDMLRERQEGIDRVNAMFGTDIKVSFNSAWLANEIEEEATHDVIKAEAIVASEEAILPLINEGGNDEVIVDTDNTEDASIDNGTGQLEEPVTPEDIEKVAEVIEAIEEVIEDAEEDEERRDNEDGTKND